MRKKRYYREIQLLMVLCLLVNSISILPLGVKAQIMAAYEDFNYGSDVLLKNAAAAVAADASKGFSSGWSATSACNTAVTNTNAIVKAGGMLQLPSLSGGAPALYRQLSNPINMAVDRDYYIRWDFIVSSGNATSNVLLDLGVVGAGPEYKMGVYNDSGFKPYIKRNSSSSSNTGTSVMALGQTYSAVAKISAKASSNDTINLRIYPKGTTETATWDASLSFSTSDNLGYIAPIAYSSSNAQLGNICIDAYDGTDLSDMSDVQTDKAALSFNDIKGSNADADHITTHLALAGKTSGASGTAISWSSSDTSVITNDGTVKRSIAGDQTVTITANISKGNVSDRKTFKVTVKKSDSLYGQDVLDDKNWLDLPNVRAVTSDITLPGTGPKGSTITWETSDVSVISATGAITRPPYEQGNATASLTAHLSKGSEADLVSESKSFDITVLKSGKPIALNADKVYYLKWKQTLASGKLPDNSFIGMELKSQSGDAAFRFGMSSDSSDSKFLPASQWNTQTRKTDESAYKVFSDLPYNMILKINARAGATENDTFSMKVYPEGGQEPAQWSSALDISCISGEVLDNLNFDGADSKVTVGDYTIEEYTDATADKINEAETKLSAAVSNPSADSISQAASAIQALPEGEYKASLQWNLDYTSVLYGRDTLSLGDISNVTSDITFPVGSTNGVTVSWQTSQPSLITEEGVVTRPKVDTGNPTVQLTATVSKGNISMTRTFAAVVSSEYIITKPTTDFSSGSIECTMTVKNQKDMPDSPSLIMALYRGKQLEAVKTIGKSAGLIQPNDMKTFKLPFEQFDETEEYTIKIFLWNDTEMQVPLMTSIIKNKQEVSYERNVKSEPSSEADTSVMIVNANTAGCERTGQWKFSYGSNKNAYTILTSSTPSASITFKPRFNQPTRAKVSLLINNYASDGNAAVEVKHSGAVDNNNGNNRLSSYLAGKSSGWVWVEIGTYDFAGDSDEYVRITKSTSTSAVSIDSAKFEIAGEEVYTAAEPGTVLGNIGENSAVVADNASGGQIELQQGRLRIAKQNPSAKVTIVPQATVDANNYIFETKFMVAKTAPYKYASVLLIPRSNSISQYYALQYGTLSDGGSFANQWTLINTNDTNTWTRWSTLAKKYMSLQPGKPYKARVSISNVDSNTVNIKLYVIDPDDESSRTVPVIDYNDTDAAKRIMTQQAGGPQLGNEGDYGSQPVTYYWDTGIFPVGQLDSLNAQPFEGEFNASDYGPFAQDFDTTAGFIRRTNLPYIFADNMVLQRNKPIPVYGTGIENDTVTVTFNGKSKSATVKEGKWQVNLDAEPAGGPYEMLVTASDGSMKFRNVMVGEVWFISGQSNANFTVNTLISSDQPADPTDSTIASTAADRQAMYDRVMRDFAGPEYQNIRILRQNAYGSFERLQNAQGSWQVCSSDVIGDFSMIALYYGKELHDKLGVPVGLINVTLGATAIETWEPAETLKEMGLTEGLGKQPWGFLYNGMAAPIQHYGLAGGFWYQGENNPGQTDYKDKLSGLIQAWRTDSGQSDLPFYLVQVPRYGEFTTTGYGWTVLREQIMLTTAMLNNVGMAVTIDTGEHGNIHPINKIPVSQRLAWQALKKTYGMDIPYTGPFYRDVQFNGKYAIVHFDFTGTGLTLQGGTEVKGFKIASSNQAFVDAKAMISGKDEVMIWSDAVTNPVAVRYACAQFPEITLFNSDGIPLAPFRTDNWPFN